MITPLRNNVIVKPLDPPEQTKSGIALPSYVDEYRNHAEVVSIGPEVRDVKPGDRVLLPDAGGARVLPDGNVHIAEGEILAVL